ncbi:TPA: DnaJ-like cysteine-rich domain-containing protein [Pseudomonas aeruginosa]|uniref:DnaJ-like cysteine-rich domain-containing protein n=1 Tax=Pseudomonas aeruginosa TaxID=287 RepID=UPI001E2D9DC5|nr:hypothetical protein [Pseudomonas aeruginosa]UFM80054.1 hypothetical protein LO755_17600 [Pseudomonas aeruginosa]UFM81072.1 hypothetical protein LO755_22930 [Pseudomonas aeruginosa]
MNKANECTCPSGDGSLVHPCPAHPAVEQAGGDERAVDGKPRATKCPDCGEGDLMPGDLCACGYETDPAAGYACSECDGSGDGYVGEVCRECDGSGWFVTPEQARAALAQPSPKCATCNGSKVVSTTDTDHNGDYIEAPCPKCGGTGEADSGGVHPWGEPVLIPCDCETEKAEAERPVVVARLYRSNDLTMTPFAEVQKPLPLPASDGTLTVDALMTVAQHERIVEARWNRAMDLMGEHVARISEKLKAERDAALARVAEMERQEPVAWVEVIDRDYGPYNFHGKRLLPKGKHQLYAAPVAQAQHSVPEGWVQSLPLKDHQPCKPNEDRANGYTIPIYSRPVLVEEALRKLRAVLCDPIGNVVIDGSDGDREEVQRALGMLAAAPGKEVPQAWLDVQAERRRQITAEGWTPEHDDEHDSGELAAAGAAYALHAADHLNPYSQGDGGDEAPSCWPWHDGIAGRGEGPEKTEPAWWKPSTPRRDLVKACALALAEIERLDRAAPGKEGA